MLPRRQGARPRTGGATALRGATVWQQTADGVVPVAVKTGISDGTWTEVVEGALAEGTPLVTRVMSVAAAAAPKSTSSNPLMATPQRGR